MYMYIIYMYMCFAERVCALFIMFFFYFDMFVKVFSNSHWLSNFKHVKSAGICESFCVNVIK